MKRKIYIRFSEGATLYHTSPNFFRKMAREAGAVRNINRVRLVNTEVLNRYIEEHFEEE